MPKSSIARLGDRIEDRVEDTVADLRRVAGEAAGDAQEALGAAATALTHAAQALVEETRARGRAAGEITVREVREHPIATAAIVLSVLAVAGLLISGRLSR